MKKSTNNEIKTMQKKFFCVTLLEIQKEMRLTLSAAFIFHLHKIQIQSVGRQQAILNCIIRQKLGQFTRKT